MYRVFTQFVNFDVKTFPLLGVILPENDCAFELDDHLVDCQMLQGIMESSTCFVQCIRDDS
jgi:hypothetical protein